MSRKIVLTLTAIILGICLLSGGCNLGRGAERVQEFKDLLRTSLVREPATPVTSLEDLLPVETFTDLEQIEVTLYYGDEYKQGLVAEKRSIEKTTAIARRTVQELLKGPGQAGNARLFPEGTQLLDISISTDGLCTVDVSNHIRNVPTSAEAHLMVYSLVNTLGEYPTVKAVNLLIEGQYPEALNSMDLSKPLEPGNYLNS